MTQANSAPLLKSITLIWKATPYTLTYEPDSKFIPGKKLSSSLLNSEAKSYCQTNYGFVGLSVISASGKNFGYSGTKSKSVKNSYKVVKGSWGVNDFGEDEYKLTVTCNGSLGSPILGKSNSYTFYLHTEFPCNYRQTCQGGFYSPSYSNLELLNSNWTIKVQFGEDWDNQNTYDSRSNVWIPGGFQDSYQD